MNKYQEALDILLKLIPDENQYFSYRHAKNGLQELVDKATPKKIKQYTSQYNAIKFECPNCNKVIYTNFRRNYCGECGQALDWSEDDE